MVSIVATGTIRGNHFDSFEKHLQGQAVSAALILIHVGRLRKALETDNQIFKMFDNPDYPKRFKALDRWFRSEFQQKLLTSAAGTPLRVAWRRTAGSRAWVVVVSGRSEYIEKYQELARDLSRRKLSVCLYDHCGQGRSGRLLSDPQKGHIDSFDTYISDLDQVLDALDEGGGR